MTSAAAAIADGMTEVPLVDLAHEGLVAVLTMARAERRDALSARMLDWFERRLAELPAGPARVIVIRGSDAAFCAGADLIERAGIGVEEKLRQRERIAALIEAVGSLTVPTIAEVGGYALGAGLELALACDLRVVAVDAQLALPETRLGIVPGAGGIRRMSLLAGPAVARDIVLSGRTFDGAEAFRLGIASRLAPSDSLGAVVMELAAQIAANAPLAIAEARAAIDHVSAALMPSELEREAGTIARLMVSDDYHEGLAAFAGRRPPIFVGR